MKLTHWKFILYTTKTQYSKKMAWMFAPTVTHKSKQVFEFLSINTSQIDPQCRAVENSVCGPKHTLSRPVLTNVH